MAITELPTIPKEKRNIFENLLKKRSFVILITRNNKNTKINQHEQYYNKIHICNKNKNTKIYQNTLTH